MVDHLDKLLEDVFFTKIECKESPGDALKNDPSPNMGISHIRRLFYVKNLLI
jgi:hypothetical protein